MIKIKNPIQFFTWEKFKDGFHDNYGEVKVIWYSIRNYDFEKIIATCRWSNESQGIEKEFPFTEQGYQEACKWIEEQRVKLIEELL